MEWNYLNGQGMPWPNSLGRTVLAFPLGRYIPIHFINYGIHFGSE
jgi:hypothetical protein